MANNKNKNNKSQRVNKQELNKKNKINNQKKIIWQIVGFVFLIIFLVLALFAILKLNSKAQSETKGIMDQFYQYYEAKENKILFYYNSTDLEDKTGEYELNYLIQIAKDYDIDYLTLDTSLLNSKNREEIINLLGISGTTPTTVVVNNKKIVAVQQGFIESHKLVEFLVTAKVLKKGSKYLPVDNLSFIDYNEYLNIVNNEYRNLVVIGESGCEYCIAAKPILNNISKGYKLKINYLDVTDLSKENLKELFDKLPDLGYDNEELKNNGTFNMPTLLIIDKGKITSYIDNVKSLDEYVSFLKKNDFIE